ncbi:MAG: EFR1 family ferrodoxin [Methanoregula sp.]|nr:EFR1 family ferrodoxin [Methanoregula sp.]
MKTIIYYFSGTGNSLAAAKKIAAALGNTELVPIASLKDTPGRIVPAADRVGIVCPVYDAGLPVIVKEFTERLDIGAVPYTFGIVTMGGMGVSALHQLNGILLQSSRRKLDAAFAIKMPGNFPPIGVPPQGDKKEAILRNADAQLASITVMIEKGQTVPPGFSPVTFVMRCLLYPPFAKNVHDMDKSFSVEDTCTSCGTCAEVCPVGNITMENDRPVWQHHCELCCACLHFCPVEAIQLSTLQGTKGRGRYRHPDLTIDDMKMQRGEQQ